MERTFGSRNSDLPIRFPRATNHHIVQFFESEKAVVEEITNYTLEGVLNQQAVVVATSAAHWSEVEKEWFKVHGEMEPYLTRGQIIFIDGDLALKQFFINGEIDTRRCMELFEPILRRLKIRYSNVRAYGDMVDTLMATGYSKAALQLETVGEELSRKYKFTQLCGYTMRPFLSPGEGATFHEVCSCHSRVIPTENFTKIESDHDKRKIIAGLQREALSLKDEIETRKKLEAELEETLKSRNEFLTLASHELRTPITSLKIQLQMAQRRFKGMENRPELENLHNMFEVADRQLQRITSLMDDLLDLAKLQYGNFQLYRETWELNEIVADAIVDIERKLSNAKIQIEFQGEEGAKGYWDRKRLNQIVENLLDNAIKFGRGKPVCISVKKTETMAILRVQDEGAGIDEKYHPLIFEQFGKVPGSPSVEGLGLGLYVSKKIVEAHGGNIKVESELGRGSVFTVELPLASDRNEGSL